MIPFYITACSEKTLQSSQILIVSQLNDITLQYFKKNMLQYIVELSVFLLSTMVLEYF